MANRTVLVDNNTWNNTHIATVGKAFASTEQEGYNIARFLGADYVLVIFGGLTNFSGDDISKFLWMIRIAGKSTTTLVNIDLCSWCLFSSKRRRLLCWRNIPSWPVRDTNDAQLVDVLTVLLSLRRNVHKTRRRQGLWHCEKRSHRKEKHQADLLRGSLHFWTLACKNL